MGAMCARDCPTEILCEQACVRNSQESKPVEIGALQRFATDPAINNKAQVFERGENTKKTIAVVGAGPAGLSCAHRLSVLGHNVTIYEAKNKISGLNEYGIAAYKATNDIAAKEAQYILDIGGIAVKTNQSLGKDIFLDQLRNEYDAIFLSPGLAATRKLNIPSEDNNNIVDAVDYIHEIRQVSDKSELLIADKVLVIGGGMTAIDIAVQSKLLGAKEVTIAYRRGFSQMGASEHEQDLAKQHEISFVLWVSPSKINLQNNQLQSITFERMELTDEGKLAGTGNFIDIEADVVFKAIGQIFNNSAIERQNNSAEITLSSGRIVTDDERRTSVAGVWAGGDCILTGDNLTVSAVQDGKVAAISIDKFLTKAGA